MNRNTADPQTALLRAAVLGNHAEARAAAERCGRELTQAQLVEALRRMAWAAGCFAGRVPAAERSQILSELANAEALLRLKGVLP